MVAPGLCARVVSSPVARSAAVGSGGHAHSQLHGSVVIDCLPQRKAGCVSPPTCVSLACKARVDDRSALIASEQYAHMVSSPGARPAAVGSGGHTLKAFRVTDRIALGVRPAAANRSRTSYWAAHHVCVRPMCDQSRSAIHSSLTPTRGTSWRRHTSSLALRDIVTATLPCSY